MRRPLVFLTLLVALLALPMLPVAGHLSAVATTVGGAVLHAQAAPAAHVDISVNHGGRGWYASPVWIAIGAIGLIVLIMLIVMASRGGGGTTVVK